MSAIKTSDTLILAEQRKGTKVAKEQNRNELDADDRALLVLMRETMKARNYADRVYAVVEAMALRRGLVDPIPPKEPVGVRH